MDFLSQGVIVVTRVSIELIDSKKEPNVSSSAVGVITDPHWTLKCYYKAGFLQD